MNNFLLYFDDEENAMDSIYEDPILKQNTTFDRPTFIFNEDAQIAGLGNIRIWEFSALYILTLLLLRKIFTSYFILNSILNEFLFFFQSFSLLILI